MLKNYIGETELKGIVPELTSYLWTSETDYSKQKTIAELIVMNDFISRSYKPAWLRPSLYLVGDADTPDTQTASTTGTASTDIDIASRSRLVVYTSALTTSKTMVLTLYGSNDGTNFHQIYLSTNLATATATVTISATGYASFTLANLYRYYRLDTTIGSATSITFEAFLTETIYDLIYGYKWLELILNDSTKTTSDRFMNFRDFCRESYNNIMSKGHFYYDENQDDDLTEDEQQRGNILTFLR